MKELSEEIYDSLVQNSEQYRERHGSWKSSYYSAILAVSGIFITVSSLVPTENEWSLAIRTLVILLSLVTCFCCIWNMLMFLSLYDNLGYAKIPKTQDELNKHYEKQVREFEKFREKSKARKFRDNAILYCFVGSTILIALSLYIPYIPCLL